MKFWSIVIILSVIVCYMVIPFGDYSIDDVSYSSTDSRNSQFRSMKLSSESFIQTAQQTANPDSGYILYSSTAISRDGDNSSTGSLSINSGHIRTGSYMTGVAHAAIDTSVANMKSLHQCPTGHTECTDNVLVSPVSGVVSEVVSYTGNPSWWGDNQWAHTTRVRIEASDDYKGWSFRILHLNNIPSYVRPGYEIKQGEYIGTQCSLGQSTGSHCHFEVLNGSAKVHVNQWFSFLSLHKSIIDIVNNTGNSPSKDKQGFTNEDINTVKSNPTYEYDISIPNECRIY